MIKREFTLYFVGNNEDDAIRYGLPFDSYESAGTYLLDNPGQRMWSATVTLDPRTVLEEEVDEPRTWTRH